MQNSRLILVSSAAALLLCALPYGCGGRAAESGENADGATSVAGMPARPTPDGSHCSACGADGSPHWDGAPITSRDGFTSLPLDGRTQGDGSNTDGFGDGFVEDGYIEGNQTNSDGRMSDGRIQGDGAPNDGFVESDGAPEGWADGSP